jgi:regulator of replication initiation timing
MDSDTKKRVNDLFDIMEGISSDIDLKGEIERLIVEVGTLQADIDVLKKELADLSAQFQTFEISNQQKQQQVQNIKEGMNALLADLK